jgi:hypothetical protein
MNVTRHTETQRHGLTKAWWQEQYRVCVFITAGPSTKLFAWCVFITAVPITKLYIGKCVPVVQKLTELKFGIPNFLIRLSQVIPLSPMGYLYPVSPMGYLYPTGKKNFSSGTLASSKRKGTGTIGSGSARRAKVLVSAPPNSKPFARHVRRRCGHEFARARARG